MTGERDIVSLDQGGKAARPAGLFDRILAHANSHPEEAALLAEGRSLSWKAMLERANGVAACLIAAGVAPGDHVGLLAARSVDAIIACLGILRAGAAYVPLDPTYAAERLGFIAADLSLSHVLVADKWAGLGREVLPETAQAIPLSKALAQEAAPGQSFPQAGGQDVANVMYTSGTTGKPKGVLVTHRGILAFTDDPLFDELGPGDSFLHTCSFAGDLSSGCIFIPLMHGAAIAVVEAEQPSLDDIAEVMLRHEVDGALIYTGLFHMLIEHRIEAFRSVRVNLGGGDVMSVPHARRVLEAWPGNQLVNLYGPTEATIGSHTCRVTPELLDGGPVPIGAPLRNHESFCVDADLTPLPVGETGQLVLAGDPVALGYFRRPEKTAEVFIPDPRPGRTGIVYLTGDLARERADGLYDFLGRVDRQLKINGHRVELDGLEFVLRGQPGIKDVTVVAIAPEIGPKRIAALLVPEAPVTDEARFVATLLDGAAETANRETLPRFVRLGEALPLTQTGKIDRSAVAARLLDALDGPKAEASGDAADLRAIIAGTWDAVLGCGPVSGETTFFEAGGTSILLIEAHARLERALGRRFPITRMFETPRLGDLAKRLSEMAPGDTADGGRRAGPAGAGAIAITGMAARLPGCESLDDFWRHIREGRNLIRRFAPEELETGSELAGDPTFVPVRPELEDADQFDAKFFSILPREAKQMDPQARVFLELCQQALEHAGIDPARPPGRIGVYAGATQSTYLLANVLGSAEALRDYTESFQLGDYTRITGGSVDSLATRVAHKLDLHGPAMSIGTACSTSLTAIAEAVQALRGGTADAVLAGGVSITFPQKRGYRGQEGGMASLDGVVRPFDEAACGTVFGHGAGVLVLRRLEDALEAGEPVHAVIRGVGLNNDGADKISYTAPSVAGQADAIRMAQRDAGLSPSEISYVECHGTATPLGDPIEIDGLSRAFGPGEAGTVALGSVKGNIGHLDAAAGVASVIKTALALKAGEIPPVANFTRLNPRIATEGTPFRVPAALEPWSSETPRRAGISSFGVGGTNAHIILEEAPVPVPEAVSGPQVLPLSARSPEALAEMAGTLAYALDASPAPDLAEAARTLQDGRSAFPWRLAIAAESHEEAVEKLRRARPPAAKMPAEAPDVVFMFPGQGAQYPGMGRGLYASEPEFARWIDRGGEILRPIMGEDITPLLTRGDLNSEDAARTLRDTRVTQPALFLVEYATARLWQARGVAPAAMIGHSVGEFAAAALAGVMKFETALRIIATRGQLMQDQPGGAMLSVRAPLDILQPHLDASVDLAANNAPKAQVVAGPFEAIEALEARLAAAGLPAKRLHTSHAFHSAMMDPVVAALEQSLSGVALAAPKIPLVSAVTGAWMTDEEARSPAFWARQARACVNFRAACERACEEGAPVLLEVGPGGTLSTFAAQALGRGGHGGVVKSLSDHTRTESDVCAMASAFSNLWAAGVPTDWARLGPRARRRTSLPGTAFQRQSYWIDPPSGAAGPVVALASETAPVMTQDEVSMTHETEAPPRLERLTTELLEIFTELSGEQLGPADVGLPFLELGFDSLFMGQVSQALAKGYGVEMTFRSLLADTPSVALLAAHLDDVLSADLASAPQVTPAPAAQPVAAAPAPDMAQPTGPIAANGDVVALMQSQLQAMQSLISQQLQLLGQGAQQPAAAPQTSALLPAAQPVAIPAPVADTLAVPSNSAFKTGRGPDVSGGEIGTRQQAFIDDLTDRYSRRFPASKRSTDAHRAAHADPRTCAGFRPEWKELTFPLVVERARGAWIEDADGNRLLDLVNGFGQTAFGHSPDFVTRAVAAQLERGYAIGPQSDKAGPLAERLATLLGHERVTFCNTGSEAVMAAMRLARAVTGREKIVVFGNDYHGQFDEVLVKGRSRGGDPIALPIAPGIPRNGLANMVVLPYDDAASLDWIRDNVAEIAGVLVEPVQSRHPALRPAEFVRSLRRITRETGSALIMDEVVTGFRTHMRGMQGVWEIAPDMATYGKVIGGGLPIGLLAGNSRFMDALDGGAWSYGDDSKPETAPTFFAGTFVRHPLVLAAIEAVLDHLDGEGASLWDAVPARAEALAGRMRAALAARDLPDLVEAYNGWMVLNVTRIDPRATLLYALMRLEGVHVLDGFPLYLTTVHTDEDCATILRAFETALDALQSAGILAPQAAPEKAILAAPRPSDATPAEGVEIPLTPGQHEIWMSHQMGPLQATTFNEGYVVTLEGALDEAALQTALDALEARHDALRMRFDRAGAHFTITAPVGLPAPLVDLQAEPEPEAALAAAQEEDAARAIDLVAGPPIRAALYRLSPKSHALTFMAHHIACDGWSFGVLIEEFFALYAAARDGRQAELAPAPSFAAHALAQSQVRPLPASQDYWKRTVAEIPSLPELPLDAPRPPVKGNAGATAMELIDRDLLKAARKAGAKQGCTLFSTLFAALQITLGRLSGSGDVVLAVPIGGQALLETPELVGHCVNLLPIRVPFAPGATAAGHLARVGETVLETFEHRDTTYGALLQDLEIERNLNRMPLTEIQFNYEKRQDRFETGGLSARASVIGKRAVNFDLFFNMAETGEGLSVEVDYNSDLFTQPTIRRWIGHFRAVLASLSEAADRPLAALPLMSPEQEAALAALGNDTAMEFDRSATLVDLLERAAEAHGARVAIEHAGREMSHAMLARRSDEIAAMLQSELPHLGGRVAVALPRGAEMLAGLIAVLKAGHAYVPLDPDQPPARLKQVVETAEVSAVLVSGALPGWVAEAGKTGLRIEDATPDARPIEVPRDPQATAYVIFTSGSTGTPKGVEIPHGAVVNFLTSMRAEPGFTEEDSLLAVTTVMFDIAVLELFAPLLAGGRVVIADRSEVLDGFRLAERAGCGDVTVMQATPTLWAMLLEAGFTPRPGLKMLAGGEPIAADLAERLMAGGGPLWNMYGPTETTIWSAIRQLQPGEPITIGGPIGNTDLHVLDDAGQLAPIGVVGELNIGGDGLARGYFNRPDLTDAAFRQVALGQATRRLYRTGDLAIRQADGGLRLLGRIDSQVKLRGYRIELGEIETRLRAQPGIAAAAVALREKPNGDKQLVGYVVADPEGAPDHGALRDNLAAALPDYMVPQAWLTLSALPQTANGKLDRKALPEPGEGAVIHAIRAGVAPEGARETQISEIWGEVLGLDEIGVTDSLHRLGADSLAVFRIAARLLDAGLGLEARDVLANPTIRALAALADTRAAGGDTGPARPSLRDFRHGARRKRSTGSRS